MDYCKNGVLRGLGRQRRLGTKLQDNSTSNNEKGLGLIHPQMGKTQESERWLLETKLHKLCLRCTIVTLKFTSSNGYLEVFVVLVLFSITGLCYKETENLKLCGIQGTCGIQQDLGHGLFVLGQRTVIKMLCVCKICDPELQIARCFNEKKNTKLNSEEVDYT